ncbi:Spore germination protein A2 [Lentibacillus sp. JNUCC-1]|uniref:GerAB/ArcD/ProY family transporter n=1 Tax=Lentibacillus sp. JNUCC-1 TaxID=2654513 RepID=UPI0012E7C612|nr:Spore germination protein A2 [Lentibacillus sp. JNUCC-1]
MKSFEYAGGKITERELMIAVTGAVIGLGILVIPRTLAAHTNAADGLVSIIIGGVFLIIMTWLIAKFSAVFPGQTISDYGATLVGKKVAGCVVFIYGIIMMVSLALRIRLSADITKQYLFDKTPLEVLALLFLFVLVYAVGGSRIGLFRLNMLFFPFVFVIVLVVIGFNLQTMEIGNLQPVFTTDMKEYFIGFGTSALTFSGFGILWFYMSLVENPKKGPKAAVIGSVIPVVLYIMLFVVIIGVFGNTVTANLVYPTVELAKNAAIPGEFLERFESVFFVIWTMAIFNSAALTLDIAVFAMTSVFKKAKKMHVILILTPIVYFIGMVPGKMYTVEIYGQIIGYITVGYSVILIAGLGIVAKIKGVV